MRQLPSSAHQTAPGECSLCALAKCTADSLSANNPPTSRWLSHTTQSPSMLRPTMNRQYVLELSCRLSKYPMIARFRQFPEVAERIDMGHKRHASGVEADSSGVLVQSSMASLPSFSICPPR
jgi:hypothetical protein